MSDDERRAAVERRKSNGRPWHTPPHRYLEGNRQYLISAACFEHACVIGATTARIDRFADELVTLTEASSDRLFAWCVLPNHYHILVQTGRIRELLNGLGRLHGRSSFEWNGEDDARGRQVWHAAVEREMRSERHLWASINYVHHNPVKHGYVMRWQDWPWSSAQGFIEAVGRERVIEIWRAYPVDAYGKDWDW